MEHPKTVGWGECGLDYFKNDAKEFEIQRGLSCLFLEFIFFSCFFL